MNRIQTLVFVAGLVGASAFGDIQYQMTSQVTGGSVTKIPLVGSKIKEPHTTTHSIKGNRMALASGNSTTIYDLDAGTVTTVNPEKKTYSVMTFEQMKAQMEESMKKMREAMADKKRDVEYTWKAEVSDAGEEKQVAGFTAHHWVLTLTGETTDAQTGNVVGTRMVIDNWMAKEVPGMQEVHEFNRRMAEKLGMDLSSSMNPMVRAQLGSGWEQAAKELRKMEGFTVYTVLKTTSTMNGQDVMVAEGSDPNLSGAAAQAAKDGATNQATSRLPGALGSSLPSLGGFGRKKKAEPQAQPAGQMVPATQIIMATELTSLKDGGFDSSVFDVPAGFKQVEDRRAR